MPGPESLVTAVTVSVIEGCAHHQFPKQERPDLDAATRIEKLHIDSFIHIFLEEEIKVLQTTITNSIFHFFALTCHLTKASQTFDMIFSP